MNVQELKAMVVEAQEAAYEAADAFEKVNEASYAISMEQSDR